MKSVEQATLFPCRETDENSKRAVRRETSEGLPQAVERIICSAARRGDVVVDLFAHSGATLIAGERLDTRVYTFDVDPIFAEISIRRLERYRSTGKTGWQWYNPFPEI